jgi:UDP-2-acetamido-3-amino-2,3-dideoxy-glucuronate N-acetyltransferase
MAHPKRDRDYDRENFIRIAPDVNLGDNVAIHALVNLYGCEIGDETKIGTFVEIQRGAKIGKRCKIQSHSFVCEGVIIEDECFVGHGVTFINDKYPASVNEAGALLQPGEWKCIQTLVKRRASIGSNVAIMCGVTIGEAAVIGAGAVVTRDVPAGAVVAGVPARILPRRRLVKTRPPLT